MSPYTFQEFVNQPLSLKKQKLTMNLPHNMKHLLLSLLIPVAFQSQASAAWSLVENFESLTTGALNGQSGWTAGTNVNVAVDPYVSSNQVGSMGNANTNAWKTMGSIILGGTATTYARFRFENIDNLASTTTGESAGFVGVSDAATPSAFTDFRTQIGVNPAFGDAVTRPFLLTSNDEDGAGAENINRFPTGPQLSPDVWYEAWTVMNNTSGEYQVYFQGGAYTTQTLLISDVARNGVAIGDPGARQESSYNFRGASILSTAPNAIKFFARSGALNQAPLYFDDIWYDASGTNLSAVPEPSKAAFLLIGLGLVFARRRRA